MQTSNSPETLAVFGRGPRCIAALYLNENDLEGVAALQSFAWQSVVFANSYQVYHAPRLAAVRPCETNEMPAREWCMGDRLPDTNLCHGHSPLLCVGRDSESFLVVNGFRRHTRIVCPSESRKSRVKPLCVKYILPYFLGQSIQPTTVRPGLVEVQKCTIFGHALYLTSTEIGTS